MGDVRLELADLLRGRILRGLQGGSLSRGDRLPSARELEGEMGLDHRVILDAYRALAEEELIKMRPRGGIYVAADAAGGAVPLPSQLWITDLLAQGVAREIPVTELGEWLHRSVATLRLRVLVVQGTSDQIDGMCRELREDYGLEASGVLLDELDTGRIEAAARRADVLVTTAGMEAPVRAVAERLGTELIVVEVRPDLLAGEWRLLLMRPLYVLVQDQQFAQVLLEFFGDTPGAENLRPLVVGRDDLSQIPDRAPVYITQSARRLIADERIRGRILPSVRLFSPESSRALIRFIVDANLTAFASVRPTDRLIEAE